MALGLVEVVRLVETVVTLAPGLLEVPILGAILKTIVPGGGSDAHAIEALEREATKRKNDRETRIKKNNRYVIKASDAMKCVEDNIMHGQFLLSLGKGIVDWIIGRAIPGTTLPDIFVERIFACIEHKVLKQSSPRTLRAGPHYHRPSKGHGHGRTHFGPEPPTAPPGEP